MFLIEVGMWVVLVILVLLLLNGPYWFVERIRYPVRSRVLWVSPTSPSERGVRVLHDLGFKVIWVGDVLNADTPRGPLVEGAVCTFSWEIGHYTGTWRHFYNNPTPRQLWLREVAGAVTLVVVEYDQTMDGLVVEATPVVQWKDCRFVDYSADLREEVRKVLEKKRR